MKEIIDYQCESRIPSREEVEQAVEIAKNKDVIIRLNWYFPYNGRHAICVCADDSADEIWENLPKKYGV